MHGCPREGDGDGALPEGGVRPAGGPTFRPCWQRLHGDGVPAQGLGGFWDVQIEPA